MWWNRMINLFRRGRQTLPKPGTLTNEGKRRVNLANDYIRQANNQIHLLEMIQFCQNERIEPIRQNIAEKAQSYLDQALEQLASAIQSCN